MKIITCDICKKEFGHSVSHMMQPMYSPAQFAGDSGFFVSERSSSDICNDCYNKIAKAQNKAIEDIKSLI